MKKFQNVVIAATMSLGLMLIGGCQTSQTGSSTHLGAQTAKQQKKSQNKNSKRVSRKTISPQPKPIIEGVDTFVGAILKRTTSKVSKKSRRKFSSKKSKNKRGYRAKRKGRRVASRRGRSRGRSYDRLIRRYARANGVPCKLARAVVQVESGFRASARGGVGEIGLMQLRKSTARGMGYRGSTRALYNPETNIKYGMRYLGRAYKLGGRSTCGAILKYNAGHGARRMNPISRRYCGKVRRIMRGRV